MVRLAFASIFLLATFAAKAGDSLYDAAFETIDGEAASLSDYKGKPVLIVNVASKCGYTGQYAGLQLLHETYAAQGLVVLGFPCNDFRGQEPGTEEEIKAFCKAEYGVAFPMASKISVVGDDVHPIFEFLSGEETNPNFHGPVKWNFEKFLIGRDGEVLNRFRTKVPPTSDEVKASIEWVLMGEAEREAAAKKDGAGPPALFEYRGREIARTMHWKGAPWLTREIREKQERASEMIAELRLEPGMDVADIGSGNGYHTLMMAKRIGEGTAYAVDVQPEMLDMLAERAERAGVGNVKNIVNRYWDADLPEASVDLALLADVYHEFSHPEEMLASIRRALRPDGRVVLLEFRTEDPDVPIKPEHKMSKAQVLDELGANGFRLVRSYDKLPWQHMLFFEKTAD